MELSTNKSIIGGILAFVLATSCCWLPVLVIALGGASGLMVFADGMEKLSGIFMAIGVGLLFYGGYQYFKRSGKQKVILQSSITCPNCGFSKMETMPTDACMYFYECEECKSILKPNKGDCCVYCSFGSVKCPPIQEGKDCCA